MSAIGPFIAFLRKRSKLTQRELAEAIGKSTKAISHFENGHYTPSVDTTEKIAAALKASPDETRKLLLLRDRALNAAWRRTSGAIDKAIEMDYIPADLPPMYVQELRDWESSQDKPVTAEKIRDRFQHDLEARPALQLWQLAKQLTPEDLDAVLALTRSLADRGKETQPQK